MSKYTFEQLTELPEEVHDHLFDPELNRKLASEVFSRLDPDLVDKVMDDILDVFFRVTTPNAFLSVLHDDIKDEKIFQSAAVNILGYAFLPLANHLNTDIKALISQNGGDPNLFRKKIPARDAVSRIRARAELKIDDPRISHRLNNILENKILGVRTDTQTAEMLSGPVKTSGVGLDAATAQVLIALAGEEAKLLQTVGVSVVPDEEYDAEQAKAAAPPPPEAAPAETAEEEAAADEAILNEELGPLPGAEPVAAPAAPVQAEVAPAAPPKETFETVSLADAKDIEAAAKTVETREDTTAVKSAEDLQSGMVDEAVAISGVKLADEDMARRFKTLVNLYFRDLRDELETKSKLTMPVASGGMGLDDAEAERVLSMLRPKLEDFQSLMSARTAAAKDKYVTDLSEKQMNEADREQQKETDKLDAMFGALVQRAGGKNAPPPAPPAPEPVRPSQPKFIPVTAPIRPALAPAAASAAPVPAKPAAPTAPPPPGLPVKPAMTPPVPPSAPPVVPAAPKPQPAPEPAREARGVVADVRIVPKLTGPIDELRSISVTDFRRLSKDPHEATLKIKDKIDLLEEQSFEARASGIKAWQESEANRLYLELLRKSLEGKPILEIIADKESKEETTLNKAEFDAIMELNRKLRFG